MAAKHTDRAVAMTPPHVLHVSVENPVAEHADEFHVVDALIAKMRRVVVKSETLVALDRGDRELRAGNIKCDFRRVHLEGKVYIVLLKRIQDRAETFAEISEACVPER